MLWDNNHKEVEGGSIQGVLLLNSSIQGVRFLYPTLKFFSICKYLGFYLKEVAN